MKNLAKIKLINWHTYQNIDIPIIGNVLVSGENGSGKSTLLDAIQYVLTAGNVKFNQAADSSSKRTLEGYIRGKLSFENKKYLREGYVISYIALEFVDSVTQRHDILGVVLELSEANSNPYKTFFTIKGKMTDDLFIENNRTKLPSMFFNQDIIQKMTSQAQMRNAIQSILGLSQTGKYFELLPKALAFKPIPDLENFVSSFLLKEDKVELDNLRENVYQFRRLEEIIKDQQEKIVDLEQLEKVYKEYCDIKDNSILLDLEKEYLKIADSNKTIKAKEKELRKLNDEYQEIINKVKLLNSDIENLNSLVREYRISLEENDNYRLKNKLEDELNSIDNSLKIRHSEEKRTLEKINAITSSLKEFPWTKKLSSLVSSKDVLKLKKEVKEVEEERKKELKKQNSLYLELLNRREKCDKKLKEISQKLSLLDKEKFLYPNSITVLQEEIQNTLSNRYQREVIIKPLCEYLKIENEEWRNAIEGYLNQQKFDLIIEPQYFDDALLIYENIKKEKNIEGVGIVNISKINNPEVVENSLFNYVSSDNPFAIKYAKYLLGRVVCCDNVDELKKYKVAITKTCMTYRNHTARQIKKHAYEDPFIGREAIRLQKDKYNLAFKETKNLYSEIDLSYRDSHRIKTLLEDTNFSIFTPYIESLDETIRLENRKNELKTELDGLVLDCLALDTSEKLAKESINLKNMKDEFNEADHRKIELEITIKNIENEVKDINENNSVIKDKLNIQVNEHIELKDRFLSECADIDNGNISYDDLHNLDNQLISRKNSIVANMLTIETSFKEKYAFDEEVSEEATPKYLEELYRIKQWDITNYKSQSIEAREKCQTSFREDFLCQIRERILSAKDSLNELNKALKPRKFGKEKYEFVFKKSLDKEMGMYYDIIMSDDITYENTLFENNLTDEYMKQINVLFDKLMADTSIIETNKVLEYYTDYRNYMSYDIRISNEDGDTYSFKEVLKEKSGGETQTPFYVLIAASFEQLLKSKRRDTSVGCFVMFDEAFNNMDESRIEAMMKFYSGLSIQLMISVPPERIATIAPYVDTNLALITKKNNTSVKAMTFKGIL